MNMKSMSMYSTAVQRQLKPMSCIRLCVVVLEALTPAAVHSLWICPTFLNGFCFTILSRVRLSLLLVHFFLPHLFPNVCIQCCSHKTGRTGGALCHSSSEGNPPAIRAERLGYSWTDMLSAIITWSVPMVQLAFISINIYIAVKLMQGQEICLSFGSSCFTIFIENAVHGCSESERFWTKPGNGGPRFPRIFRCCEQGNLFRAPYCINWNIDIWHQMLILVSYGEESQNIAISIYCPTPK